MELIREKPDEQAYVISSTNEDIEMRDVQDEEEDEEEVLSELDPDEGALAGLFSCSMYSFIVKNRATRRMKNLCLLSFMENGTPSWLWGIKAIAPTSSEEITSECSLTPAIIKSSTMQPSARSPLRRGGSSSRAKYLHFTSVLMILLMILFKVMLHQQDSKMVLMNTAEPHSLYSMDIERGKIVEEWKVHEDVTVDHIAPDTKFAQTTPGQTLVGASHNALFRIDPRVSGHKMVDSQYKQYVSKNKFSGVATTESGKLAVASAKGDIRLFDSIGKNAKTALPPLGDPIIGVDVTADGRWIVATTKTYLLLIDTLIGEGRYAGSLGFDRSFPANAKPMPRRLQLRGEHVAYMNHEINFSPAR